MTQKIEVIRKRIEKRIEQQGVNGRIMNEIHNPKSVHYRDHSYLRRINYSNKCISMMLEHLMNELERIGGYDKLKMMG